MLVCNVQDLFVSRHASVNCGFKPSEKMEMVEPGGLHVSRKEHIIYWPKVNKTFKFKTISRKAKYCKPS